MIRITLPGTPRGKGRPRFGRGYTYTDPRTAAYERDLGWAGVIAMKGRKPLQGPLSVTIRAYFAIPKSWSKAKKAAALLDEIRPTCKPDFDNIAKAVCDGLNKIVWKDDAQIVSSPDISKYYSFTPRVDITVEEIRKSK